MENSHNSRRSSLCIKHLPGRTRSPSLRLWVPPSAPLSLPPTRPYNSPSFLMQSERDHKRPAGTSSHRSSAPLLPSPASSSVSFDLSLFLLFVPFCYSTSCFITLPILTSPITRFLFSPLVSLCPNPLSSFLSPLYLPPLPFISISPSQYPLLLAPLPLVTCHCFLFPGLLILRSSSPLVSLL